MDAPMFYTPLAEYSKIGLYVILFAMVLIALWIKRYRPESNWRNWIHTAIFIHFFVGAFYSGIRMVTMNEIDNMLIRRIYACEAWFNFACASFYFLFLYYIATIKSGGKRNEA